MPKSQQSIRVSLPALVILGAFSLAQAPLWGSQIMRSTHITTGTAYPLLNRLETDGYLKGEWEKADPRDLQRPRQKMYVLTPRGKTLFEDFFKQILGLKAGI